MYDYDVIVIGAGNAALAASVSARENGAEKVLVLEKAPRAMRGGNTHWSGGVLRFAFDDPQEIAPLLPGVENDYEDFFAGVSPYPKDRYLADLQRVTSGRTDPELSNILVSNSKDTVFWMNRKRREDGTGARRRRREARQRGGLAARPDRARGA